MRKANKRTLHYFPSLNLWSRSKTDTESWCNVSEFKRMCPGVRSRENKKYWRVAIKTDLFDFTLTFQCSRLFIIDPINNLAWTRDICQIKSRVYSLIHFHHRTGQWLAGWAGNKNAGEWGRCILNRISFSNERFFRTLCWWWTRTEWHDIVIFPSVRLTL